MAGVQSGSRERGTLISIDVCSGVPHTTLSVESVMSSVTGACVYTQNSVQCLGSIGLCQKR